MQILCTVLVGSFAVVNLTVFGAVMTALFRRTVAHH